MASTDIQIPSYVRFAIAGLSGGGASFVSHPFDLIKYRMQLSGKGNKEKAHKTTFHATRHIIQNEGILGVYNGLSASIFRQLTLTMIRLGLYSSIVDSLTAADGTPPSLICQVIAGLVSGGVGAVIGNPADIALVRMSTDGANPPSERKNYKHVFDAMARIKREEGVKGLWTGWRPAAVRCMVLNVTQIVLYKNTKMMLLETVKFPLKFFLIPISGSNVCDAKYHGTASKDHETSHFKDDPTLHVICSVWTALASSVATAPIDITKTRLMTMKSKGGQSEYDGMIDACLKIIKHEGVFSLWKGVTPTFARILPNNFMIFLLLELLTKTYKRVVLGDKTGSGF